MVCIPNHLKAAYVRGNAIVNTTKPLEGIMTGATRKFESKYLCSRITFARSIFLKQGADGRARRSTFGDFKGKLVAEVRTIFSFLSLIAPAP